MAYRSTRIAVTDRARQALRELIEHNGPILLYLARPESGDASTDSDEPSPIWLPIRDFRAQESDIRFGRLVWHTELWMNAAAFAQLEHKHITVDVGPEPAAPDAQPVAEPAADPDFRLRVRGFTATEAAALEALARGVRGITSR